MTLWLTRMLVVTCIGSLTACSKTVQWEEDVPLNTGETIVVKRSGRFNFECDIAVGTGCGYKPGLGGNGHGVIDFTYRGQKFHFVGDSWMQLLAISNEGVPNLVSSAGQWGNSHGYRCVTPYYVQFRPDNTGKHWTWPDRIEPWLYNLPTNLLIGFAPLDSDGKTIGQSDREELNRSILIYREFQQIDPTKRPENCVNPKAYVNRNRDG